MVIKSGICSGIIDVATVLSDNWRIVSMVVKHRASRSYVHAGSCIYCRNELFYKGIVQQKLRSVKSRFNQLVLLYFCGAGLNFLKFHCAIVLHSE
jgi:hypothetical protein